MGLGPTKKRMVFIIDFGLARRYLLPTGEIRPISFFFSINIFFFILIYNFFNYVFFFLTLENLLDLEEQRDMLQ